MSTRGKLLAEPLRQSNYTVVDARQGFVRCLAAYKLVEEGQAVYLHGQCDVPRPFARMLARVELGLRTAPAPFIGNWDAPVLLVGDRPSVGRTAQLPNWPFISGIATGCSVWLTEKLEEYGIPESSLCWVNAFDRLGNPTDLREATRFPRVIALGRNAREALTGVVPCEQAYHPQYWKRFHSRKPYQLIQLIREVL